MNGTPTDILADSKFEDKFWMRESVVIKRMELLVNVVLKLAHQPLKKKGRVMDDQELMDHSGSEDNVISTTVSAKRGRRAKSSLGVVAANKTSPPTSVAPAKDGDSSDTDEMLLRAESTLSKPKAKRKKTANKPTALPTTAPFLSEMPAQLPSVVSLASILNDSEGSSGSSPVGSSVAPVEVVPSLFPGSPSPFKLHLTSSLGTSPVSNPPIASPIELAPISLPPIKREAGQTPEGSEGDPKRVKMDQ
jgi:hypothetical protein